MSILSHKLVLGSKSPRRQALLSGMGLSFEVRTNDTDESFSASIPIHSVAGYLAQRKADALVDTLTENELLITSDTVVVIGDDSLLGKPENKEDAFRMLSMLSGKTHTVITGVCLRTQNESHLFSDKTDVTFLELSDDEILFYLNRCAPYDKAGSYGVQEFIGYVGISSLNGSFYTVMGLPTHLVWLKLKEFGFLNTGDLI
jgi:septum formation protein